MSKTIRVEDPVYQELEAMRDWKETFSQVIGKLTATRLELCRLMDVVEGQIRFREWQREKNEREKESD